MSGKKLTLDKFTESLAGFLKYEESTQNTNEIEHRKLLKIMSKIISSELTKRQKDCLIMHYYDNLGVCQIAYKLNIDKSTASRHVSRAKYKIKRILSYYLG